MSTWRKLLGWIIALAATGGVSYFAYQGLSKKKAAAERAPAEDKPIPVQVATVALGDIADELRLTGEVKAASEVQIFAKIAGRIEELRVSEGSEVKQGEVIAVLDHEAQAAQVAQAQAALVAAEALVEEAQSQITQAQSQVVQARSQVALATAAHQAAQAQARATAVSKENLKTERERIRRLFEQGAATKQQRDAAETQYAAAAAQLDAAQAQVEQARAQIEQGNARLAQAQAAEQATGVLVQVRKAQVLQAQAALQAARVQLAETTVKATISGIIARKFADRGDMASPAQPLCRLVQVDKVKVVVGVTEGDLTRIAPGETSAAVKVDAFPGRSFPGVVAKVYPALSPRTWTAEVEIILENPRRELRPGMFARVCLTLQKHAGVTIIPKDALLARNGQEYVYVVEGDVARRRTVETGLRQETWVQVTSGLVPGEVLVVGGMQYLRPGAKVTVNKRDQQP